MPVLTLPSEDGLASELHAVLPTGLALLGVGIAAEGLVGGLEVAGLAALVLVVAPGLVVVVELLGRLAASVLPVVAEELSSTAATTTARAVEGLRDVAAWN